MPLPPHSLHTLCCRPCSQPAARGCRRRILCKPYGVARARRAAAAALPAIIAPPPVLANATPTAFLALAAAPTVLAAPLSPPYSMHASRDNNSRCFCRRSPCRGSAAARARICWRYRTHRTGGGAARARRGSFSTTPNTPNTPNTPKHAKTGLFCVFLFFICLHYLCPHCFHVPLFTSGSFIHGDPPNTTSSEKSSANLALAARAADEMLDLSTFELLTDQPAFGYWGRRIGHVCCLGVGCEYAPQGALRRLAAPWSILRSCRYHPK